MGSDSSESLSVEFNFMSINDSMRSHLSNLRYIKQVQR